VRKRLFLALLVLGGGAVAAYRLRLPELARIGAGYAAQQTCSCLFVSHRPFQSCRMDLEPLARAVVWISPGVFEVTARSMIFARATAKYDPTYGCSLIE
jgi:hypothetical protein